MELYLFDPNEDNLLKLIEILNLEDNNNNNSVNKDQSNINEKIGLDNNIEKNRFKKTLKERLKERIGNLDDSNDVYSSEFSYNIDKKPRKRKTDDFPGEKKINLENCNGKNSKYGNFNFL